MLIYTLYVHIYVAEYLNSNYKRIYVHAADTRNAHYVHLYTTWPIFQSIIITNMQLFTYTFTIMVWTYIYTKHPKTHTHYTNTYTCIHTVCMYALHTTYIQTDIQHIDQHNAHMHTHIHHIHIHTHICCIAQNVKIRQSWQFVTNMPNLSSNFSASSIHKNSKMPL